MKRPFAATILRLQRPPVLTVEPRPDGSIRVIGPGGGGTVAQSTATNTGTNEGTTTSSSTHTNEGTTSTSGTTTNSRWVGAPITRQPLSMRPLVTVTPAPMTFDRNGLDQIVDGKGGVHRPRADVELTGVEVGEVRRGGDVELVGYTPGPDGGGGFGGGWPGGGFGGGGLPGGGLPGGGGPLTGDASDSDDDSDSDNSGDSDDAGDSDNARDSDDDEDMIAREGVMIPHASLGFTPPLAPGGLKAKSDD